VYHLQIWRRINIATAHSQDRRIKVRNNTSKTNSLIQVRYRNFAKGGYRKGQLSQRSAHAEQYAQTKTNTNPSPVLALFWP